MKKLVTRGSLVFVVGLGGIIIELVDKVFRGHAVDPTLLLIFGAMIGLPKMLEIAHENGTHSNGKEK